MLLTEEQTQSHLATVVGATLLHKSLIEHEWATEEDAIFVATCMGKFVVDIIVGPDVSTH